MIIDFCVYNIRGLNNKKAFVKDFIRVNKITLFALLETHVKQDAAVSISKFIAPRFSWVFNYAHHYHGRIWLGWDQDIWNVSVIDVSAQHISCTVMHIATGTTFTASFIYGFNTLSERRTLWQDMLSLKQHIGNEVNWCLLGDFNTCLAPDEISCYSRWTTSMLDFNQFLLDGELTDLRSTGNLFTWWDSNINVPTFRRLDRCIVNGTWIRNLVMSYAHVLPRGISDHCPIAINLGVARERIFKPFQCFQHIIDHPDFMETIAAAWESNGRNVDPWYSLTTKLRRCKDAMKLLNLSKGNLHDAVATARGALTDFQQRMSSRPTQADFAQESLLCDALNKALLEEEVLLKQKSRVTWLEKGDNNNRFFFNSCKGRWNSNKILMLESDLGEQLTSHKDIANVAISYFKSMVGQERVVDDFPEDLEIPQITENQRELLVAPFTRDDIYRTFKNLAKHKCPGPDGLTAEFYLATWSIIGNDVTDGILHFFNNLHLPRIVNSVAIALIPKHGSAATMADFRPISCCNVLYKCISKLLTDRMKVLMASLISPNQSAFVPKRSIGDNILLAQALCRNYHLNSGKPRCAIKLDLRKAFDTLSWSFLFKAMERMGFPAVFIRWVTKCITTCMISVKINGALEGYFKAESGLRQGDPMSPYLFVIAMEIFSACLKKKTNVQDFKVHCNAQQLRLTHLIFADDVLLFCHADKPSIKAILNGVNQFSAISGLYPNASKSECFFSCVPNDVKQFCLHSSGFQEGKLPIMYLGLPLIATKLTERDCAPLFVKIRRKIEAWTCRTLSRGGRLRLLKVILFAIQSYWTSHLFLPKGVIRKIQSLFSKFLWGGTINSNAQVNVAWHICCKPKMEGGLGIKDLFEWNKAAILFQLWRILQPNRNSLWNTWLWATYLRNKPLWSMKVPYNASWCLKKMLNAREEARLIFKYVPGQDSTFLFWHDPWLNHSSIVNRFHSDIISIAESTQLEEARVFIDNGAWRLPPINHVWLMDLRDNISHIPIANADSITCDNMVTPKISITWNSIRNTGIPQPWLKLVWHPLHIKKCSFFLWLALQNRLLTKDRMLAFGMNVDSTCVLCNREIETIQHLFTTCVYSRQVFKNLGLPLCMNWNEYLLGNAVNGNLKTVHQHLCALFLAVAGHSLWQERNERIHNQGHSCTAVHVKHKAMRILREKVCTNAMFKKAAAKDFSITLALF